MANLTTETTLRMADGVELYTKTWHVPPGTTPRARLAFVHGFSDHINFHDPLFEQLALQGIESYGYDQRGWGRSAKAKKDWGATGPTELVLNDLTTFLQNVISSAPSENATPLFVMGHSMGGGELLTYMVTGPRDVLSRIRGFVVEAPWVSLHPRTQPNGLTLMAGRFAGKLLPKFQMVNHLDLNAISRDPEIGKRIKADPLCHSTGTLEGLAGALDRAADLDSGRLIVPDGIGEGGKTRLWIAHGTEDAVCYFDSAKKVFERATVEDKEFKAYEGWFHKLHQEIGDDKIQFINDMAAWILKRSGPLA